MEKSEIFNKLKGAMLSELISKLKANELDLASIEALPAEATNAADEDLMDAVNKAFEVSEAELEAEYVAVAKTKGLDVPENGLVMKRMGFNVGGKTYDEEEAVTKGAKRSKKKTDDYYPDEKELAQINELSNIDLDKKSVYVFTLTSADTITDRSSDRFSPKALSSMAEMSKDKPYLRDHNWNTSSVVGKIFDAKVTDKKLMQKIYVPISAKNEEVIAGMMDGTLNKVSVGFATAPQDYVCTSCSKSLYSRECSHYPGSKDERGNVTVGEYKDVKDYFEVSNVAVPCLPAAGIRRGKSVDRINTEIQGDETVEETAKATEQLTEAVVAPEETVVTEVKAAEETPAVETAAPEVAAEPVVAAVETKSSEVSDILLALKDVVVSLTEVANEIKAAQAAKVEVEKTAVEESTEEIARKLAATALEGAAAPEDSKVKVDFTKSGWGNSVLAALTKKAPTNQ